ncbi:hypothetical protein Bca4012_000858 [Brassica carinata]
MSQDPPLFAVTEMLVHMSVPTEYSSHVHFEEALLDQLIHSPLAIGLPSYPYLFVHPGQSTISSFFLPFMFGLFNSLTGRGTKREIHYVQLQYSVLLWRQCGFLNIPLGRRAISHFVELVGIHIFGDEMECGSQEMNSNQEITSIRGVTLTSTPITVQSFPFSLATCSYIIRIYVGNGEVIHFTCGGGLGTRTGTSVDNIIVSSVPNHGGDNPCPNCRDQSNLDGVISSCLDCFLAGGNLYLFEYGVSGPIFMAKPRGAICTTAVSDSSDETVHRARYLLSKKNGFAGSSGQANSWSAARGVFSLWGTVKSVSVGSAARLVVSGVAGIGVMAMAGYGNYCYGRLCADIGVRSDTSKVPVEDLVMLIAIIERRDDKKSS